MEQRRTGVPGRFGLFQFNEQNWYSTGTTIPWNIGNAAKDPEQAASVALASLFDKLGYRGVANPAVEAITKAIDRFGEGDGRYGQAVMDCASGMGSGDFVGALGILKDYATWVQPGRP